MEQKLIQQISWTKLSSPVWKTIRPNGLMKQTRHWLQIVTACTILQPMIPKMWPWNYATFKLIIRPTTKHLLTIVEETTQILQIRQSRKLFGSWSVAIQTKTIKIIILMLWFKRLMTPAYRASFWFKNRTLRTGIQQMRHRRNLQIHHCCK